MSVLLKGISKTALLTFTTFMLSACLPEMETSEQEEQTSFVETGNKSLSLPSPSLDYVSYADADLPAHFIDGDDPVTSHDNTPNNNPITNTGATLGRVLFYDTALSINDAVSCASCHQQDTGFTDDAILSTGFQDGLTGRHSMSLTNSRFYQSGKFFWDERADTLEEQVLMPIQDDVEMGMALDTLVIKLAETNYYPALFKDAFGDTEITSERIAFALAQFVRAMVSYQSKYDSALSTATQDSLDANDLSHVLNTDEEAGRLLFENAPPQGGLGCAGCHGTVAQITDRTFNIGLDLNTPDDGAGNGEFKVPSLRNIAVSAPYMHDGRFETLSDVIEHYNSGVQDHPNLAQALRHPTTDNPVRLNMSAQEKTQLEAFLNALTDETLNTSELFSDPFQ